MTSEENTTQANNSSDTVEVEDLDQFVHHLIGWHTSKVNVLQHMMAIPPGSEMQTDEGAPVIMEGAFLEGFRAGIALSLMELGNLPFTAESDPVSPAAADVAAVAN